MQSSSSWHEIQLSCSASRSFVQTSPCTLRPLQTDSALPRQCQRVRNFIALLYEMKHVLSMFARPIVRHECGWLSARQTDDSILVKDGNKVHSSSTAQLRVSKTYRWTRPRVSGLLSRSPSSPLISRITARIVQRPGLVPAARTAAQMQPLTAPCAGQLRRRMPARRIRRPEAGCCRRRRGARGPQQSPQTVAHSPFAHCMDLRAKRAQSYTRDSPASISDKWKFT